MKAVVTRVSSASVTIDGVVEGAIDKGYLVLLGVGPDDTVAVCDKLCDKICNLRVFEDENGKMNLNLEQVGGSLLVISQFPLRRHLLPPSRLLRGRQTRSGHPSLRALHGKVPGARLPGGARSVRRGYEGRLRE